MLPVYLSSESVYTFGLDGQVYTHIILRVSNSTIHLFNIISIKLWEYACGYWAETFKVNVVPFEFQM